MKSILYLVGFVLLNKLCFGQQMIPAYHLQTDTKLLWQALNELHPGLYRHTDTITLTNAYENLLKDFSSDKTEAEAFLLLSRFTTKIKCGHTYVNPYNQPNKIITSVLKNKVLPPFTFSIIDKKLVVEKPLDELIDKDAVITHINEIPVAQIIDSLSQYIKADGNRTMKKIKDLEVTLASKYEYFDYYFPMIYDIQNNITITFSNGAQQKISLLTKAERSDRFKNQYPESNLGYYDGLWSYRFEENYAYLKLGTFATYKMKMDWEAYLDNFFSELENKKIQNLIIDIRGNEGGMDDVGKYLIKKLAKKEVRMVLRKPHLAYKKVSDQVSPHVSNWSKWFYNTALWTKKLNDTYRTFKFSANKPKKIKQNKNAFQGQTFLMIDVTNSSATFLFAEDCKRNQYATLVGTATGGTKKGITGGQMFFLTLPYSKIEVDIPLIGQYSLVEMPDEGIQPDVFVARTLEGVVGGRDEEMEKVIELLEIR